LRVSLLHNNHVRGACLVVPLPLGPVFWCLIPGLLVVLVVRRRLSVEFPPCSPMRLELRSLSPYLDVLRMSLGLLLLQVIGLDLHLHSGKADLVPVVLYLPKQVGGAKVDVAEVLLQASVKPLLVVRSM
jgi:hypothetical protein